jgi:hypothetical protein
VIRYVTLFHELAVPGGEDGGIVIEVGVFRHGAWTKQAENVLR